MVNLVIKSLKKDFSGNVIFNDFNLTVKSGSVVAILGASGVGKSTLLNIISGEITDYQGEVIGRPKKISHVFNKDRLVPSLTVFENVRLVLGDEKNKKLDDLCYDVLKKVGLNNAVNLYPRQLSTGMSKRVNLARAFVYGADLMLMDEPFANLDLVTKFEITDLFSTLQKESGQTAILVTHDVSEAIYLADELVVIKRDESPIVIAKGNDDDQTIIAKIKSAFKSCDKIEKL